MAEQQTPPKFPFDDDIMTYDYNSHMYVLTKEGVLAELGENLDMILNATADANPSTLAARVLKRVSQSVYRWLYRDTMGKDWLEYMLATYPPLRDVVKQMLQAQLLYVLNNGFLSDYSGVNIAKGQIMDEYKLRGRVRISPEVEDLGMQDIPGLGICLKYAGALPCLQYWAYHRGY